ncbi:hypothetical protein SynBIOSE41_02819 [Synechococcus sp. BIOS-E4-1]|nr:hypothetical protein SynBIOSE41_02819 [Synechococcus sp. BIOS-E4-1]
MLTEVLIVNHVDHSCCGLSDLPSCFDAHNHIKSIAHERLIN